MIFLYGDNHAFSDTDNDSHAETPSREEFCQLEYNY